MNAKWRNFSHVNTPDRENRSHNIASFNIDWISPCKSEYNIGNILCITEKKLATTPWKQLFYNERGF